MQKWKVLMAALAALLAVALIGGCTGAMTGGGERSGQEGGSGEAGGEHGSGGEGGSGTGGDGGEEGGARLAPDETFDMVRKGARLILSYDARQEAFTGTVENTTGVTLRQVRVEVHLFNPNAELGPTPPQDLPPGERIAVNLPAAGRSFTHWTPHAEVGPQSSGGEAGGEHGRGGEGGSEGSGGEHGAGGESGSN